MQHFPILMSGYAGNTSPNEMTKDTQFQISSGSMKHLKEAKTIDDDWTGMTLRKERKKRQNRLNQRASSKLLNNARRKLA